MNVPEGWIIETYTLEGVEWSVVYCADVDNKQLYVGETLVCESDTDGFSFEQDGKPVRVVRHLRYGFYELEITRDGQTLLTGEPASSAVKGPKGKLMMAAYMLFAIWSLASLREMIGF